LRETFFSRKGAKKNREARKRNSKVRLITNLNKTMKKTFSLACLLVSCAAFSQDYIVKPDGTEIKGKMISVMGNTLRIEDKNDETLTFKVDELSEIYVANPNFNMNRLRLNHGSYTENKDGIRIKLLDNPIEPRYESTNSEINASSSDQLSIVSDSQSKKVSLVLTCKDCSNSGKLRMESEDGKSSVKWSFKADGKSVFPKTIEVDVGKTYSFNYFDPKNGKINKKIQVRAEEDNKVDVFE
jgi:hypothetical protein